MALDILWAWHMKMQLINLMLTSGQNSQRMPQKILTNFEYLQQNSLMGR